MRICIFEESKVNRLLKVKRGVLRQFILLLHAVPIACKLKIRIWNHSIRSISSYFWVLRIQSCYQVLSFTEEVAICSGGGWQIHLLGSLNLLMSVVNPSLLSSVAVVVSSMCICAQSVSVYLDMRRHSLK